MLKRVMILNTFSWKDFQGIEDLQMIYPEMILILKRVLPNGIFQRYVYINICIERVFIYMYIINTKTSIHIKVNCLRSILCILRVALPLAKETQLCRDSSCFMSIDMKYTDQ